MKKLNSKEASKICGGLLYDCCCIELNGGEFENGRAMYDRTCKAKCTKDYKLDGHIAMQCKKAKDKVEVGYIIVTPKDSFLFLGGC